jgi:pimeloyl-ACP methyl ester carboxylesterase
MMELRHGRMKIQLHELSPGSSSERTPLLLLHALGSSSAEWGDPWRLWEGPVHAVDFAGHGRSDSAVGSSYYPELFLIDADLALAAIGDRACLAGSGVGAYVAMLLAGSRPDRVPAALLLPGRGLACGGSQPDFERPPPGIDTWEERIQRSARSYDEPTDPFVAVCEQDIRPRDYASDFARAARQLLFSEAVQPETSEGDSLGWWQSAKESSGGKDAPRDPTDALRALASAAA